LLIRVVLFLCLQGPDADHALRIDVPIVARFVDICEIYSAPIVQDEREIVEGVRGRATQFVQGANYFVLAVRVPIRRVLLEYYVTKTLGIGCDTKNRGHE
jgi:hypothetical protein